MTTLLRKTSLVALLCSLWATNAFAEQESFVINGVRPVEMAVEKLEQIYGIPISYEEALWSHQGELIRDVQGHPIAKSTSIKVAYTVPTTEATLETRKHLVAEAIANALAAYDEQGGTTKFKVTESDDSFHVIPSESKDASGNLGKKVEPMLDTPITVGKGEQSAAKYMADIAFALSSGTQASVVSGTLPTPLFYQYKADVTANNEPAWKVLTGLFAQIPVGYFPEALKSGKGEEPLPTKLSWTFLCDHNGECAISAHVVSPGGKPTVGMQNAPKPAVE